MSCSDFLTLFLDYRKFGKNIKKTGLMRVISFRCSIIVCRVGFAIMYVCAGGAARIIVKVFCLTVVC